MTISIEVFRRIMLNEEKPLRRRLKAAEMLLTYEAPAEITDETRGFLNVVAEDAGVNEDLQMEAAVLLRKAEARKVTQPPASAESEAVRREEWRKWLLWHRQVELHHGIDPPPKGWDDDLRAEDFVPPDGESPFRADPSGSADRMEAARLDYLRSLGPKAEG
jgi:hypothetical protein